MPRLWAVTASVTIRNPGRWRLLRQVPTFYLDPLVQGIAGPEHARSIAEDILRSATIDDTNVEVDIHVEPVE